MTTVAQAQSAVQEPKPKRRRLKVELPHIDDPVHSRVEWDRNPDKRFTPMKEYRRRAAASPDLSAWELRALLNMEDDFNSVCGGCWKSIEAQAKEMHCDVQRVKEARAHLSKAGFLMRVKDDDDKGILRWMLVPSIPDARLERYHSTVKNRRVLKHSTISENRRVLKHCTRRVLKHRTRQVLKHRKQI